MNLNHFKLQYITNCNNKFSHIDGAKFALDGGCRWIQLRIKMKNFDYNIDYSLPQNNNEEYETIQTTAAKLKILCDSYDATFIIDDYVQIAKNVNANGVHLGKLDLPPDKAREILGKKFIIGGTANSYSDIIKMFSIGVDYIGLGPYRYTTTKASISSLLGLDNIKRILAELSINGIYLPIAVIGGITANDINDIVNAGASGIAISGAILNSENPEFTTKSFMEKIP